MATPTNHQLPVELYNIFIRELSTVELHAMSLASHWTNQIATPLVYQGIVFQRSTRLDVVNSLLHTLLNRVDLSMLVQHLVLAWTGQSDQISNINANLRTVLPKLVNLQHLTVFRSLEIHTEIFDHVTLPKLRHFHYFAADESIFAFFNRHPRLQTVTTCSPREYRFRHWGFDLEMICLWNGG